MEDPQNPVDAKDTLEIDWPLFGELCRALALRIAQNYEPDLVVGIAKAGVVPGAVVASMLGCEFAAMSVTRRRGGARPVLVAGPPDSLRDQRVLIVDETCDTGDTLKVALNAVRKLGPADVRTAVSIKTGRYAPDYHALETENFIILPWDREVVIGGELTLRPEYRDRLEAEADEGD
jgi:hypoxanthine phosphoribosyltransferase